MMIQIALTDLWPAFSTQTQHHLVRLWTELLHRRLQTRRVQAERVLVTGGTH